MLFVAEGLVIVESVRISAYEMSDRMRCLHMSFAVSSSLSVLLHFIVRGSHAPDSAVTLE